MYVYVCICISTVGLPVVGKRFIIRPEQLRHHCVSDCFKKSMGSLLTGLHPINKIFDSVCFKHDCYANCDIEYPLIFLICT